MVKYSTWQYCIHATRTQFKSYKTLAFVIICMILVILQYYMQSDTGEIQFGNWELSLSILLNDYYQLFLFSLYFLFYIHTTCVTEQSSQMIVLRFQSKRDWISSRIIITILIGLVYTIIYFLCQTVFPVFFAGWYIGWADPDHESYQQYIEPLQVWGIVFFKYLLAIWFIGILYLLVADKVTKSRSLFAFLILFIILWLNKSLAISLLNQQLAFLSLNVSYINLLNESDHAFIFLLKNNTYLALSLIGMVSLLYVTSSTKQFSE